MGVPPFLLCGTHTLFFMYFFMHVNTPLCNYVPPFLQYFNVLGTLFVAVKQYQPPFLQLLISKEPQSGTMIQSTSNMAPEITAHTTDY